MSIHSEVVSSDKETTAKYPYIGKHSSPVNGLVVLFSKSHTGTVLATGNSPTKRHIGDYSTEWLEQNFTRLSVDEVISLRNY